jgi:hypothetical protein
MARTRFARRPDEGVGRPGGSRRAPAAAGALGALTAADLLLLPQLLTVEPGLGDLQALLCLTAVLASGALALVPGRASWRLAVFVAVGHLVLVAVRWLVASAATPIVVRLAAVVVAALAVTTLLLAAGAGRRALRPGPAGAASAPGSAGPSS